MSGTDTSIGGGGPAFPATSWGLVSRLDPAAQDYAVGMEELCRRYWRPIYRYARVAWAKSNEDAKDLTQAFLIYAIEERSLDRYEPARGRFRAFLKALLRRFISHQERAMQTLKRGGGVRLIALDDPAVAEEPAPEAGDPESVFDRAWVTEIVTRGIDRVRRKFPDGPRAIAVRIYEAYDLAPKESRPTYDELGARHGMTFNQVDVALSAIRQEVKKAIREELAVVTAGDAELQDEWDALFGR